MAEFISVNTRDAVATVTLTRAELHNAFNEVVIAELTGAFRTLDVDESVRMVVLAGAGKSFCGGAGIQSQVSVKPTVARNPFRGLLQAPRTPRTSQLQQAAGRHRPKRGEGRAQPGSAR